MNKYDFVPMNIEPIQIPTNTYLSGNPRHIEEQQMPQYIYDLLNKEQQRLRDQSGFNGFGFGKQVMPDNRVASLRSKDPMRFYSREAGTFGVSEANQLLQDDYNAKLYDLIQSKSRANATKTILNNIFGVTDNYYPNTDYDGGKFAPWVSNIENPTAIDILNRVIYGK